MLRLDVHGGTLSRKRVPVRENIISLSPGRGVARPLFGVPFFRLGTAAATIVAEKGRAMSRKGEA